MKRKYYYMFAVIIVLIAMVIIPSLQKPTIPEAPVPENPFPISEDSITSAFKNAKLEITLDKKTVLDNPPYNTTAYFMMNKDGKMIGIFNVVYNSTYRMVGISTLNEETSLRDIFPKEDFPKLVSVATELYGGFSDNSQPYNYFSKDVKAGKYKDITNPSVSAVWDKKMGDIICSISMINDTKSPSTPIPTDITIMNDAVLQETIVASENAVNRTKERLANFPEQNNKKNQTLLADQEKALERLKSIK